MKIETLRKILPRSLRTFIVGVYNGFKRYWINTKSFGYLAESAKLATPLHVEDPNNIFIYDYADIGPQTTILNKNAKFIIKKWSVSAGKLTVVTGNHARKVGRFLLSIKEIDKPKGFDKDVVVNEDVWMGMNVTLLSGVEIGRGATIAAGAVVTKSIPPYCIAGGVPARVIKFYWTVDEILCHEEKLYVERERFSRSELESIFKQFCK